MRNVTLFIAMSLDGFIAGKDGNVNWLQGQEPDREDMESYFEFIKEIDTVIIGWKTYDQIVNELSKEEWMYKDLTSYIITHREMKSSQNIIFVNEDVCNLINTLKQKTGKGIWICGGASIISPLMKEKLIDKIHISIIPTILGDGIRLFENTNIESKLKLIETKNYNGITDVIYEFR